jgi:hypothetical protein
VVPDGGNRQPGLHHLEHLHPQLLLDTHPHPSQRVREVVCVPVPKSWSCGVQTGCRFCPSAAFNGRFHVSLQSPRSKIPQSHAITGTRLAMTYASSSSSTNRTCAVAQTNVTRPHVTRHTSHVTRHTSHVHTSHVARHTSHVTRHTSHVTRHTSHARRAAPAADQPQTRENPKTAWGCKCWAGIMPWAGSPASTHSQSSPWAASSARRRRCGCRSRGGARAAGACQWRWTACARALRGERE